MFFYHVTSSPGNGNYTSFKLGKGDLTKFVGGLESKKGKGERKVVVSNLYRERRRQTDTERQKVKRVREIDSQTTQT
jgi:hypothetical protein